MEHLTNSPQLETYHGPGNPEHHGFNGPVHVSNGTYRSKGSESDFINGTAEVGWPEIKDLQTLDANNGVERWLRYVSKDGRRQDTATAYLHSKIDSDKYPNLHVLVESKVVRVILDDEKRAVGVEYTPNPAFQAQIGPTQHPKLTVKARKLVVVSCGALGTPPVLERSGLGDPATLKKAGVDVKLDLPGVGHEYQDHQLVLYPFKTALEPHETIDRVLRNPHKRQELIDAKDPILGWNSIDISSKFRPTEADVAALGPEFQKKWDKDFKNAPNRPLMLMGLVSWYVSLRSLFLISQTNMTPVSLEIPPLFQNSNTSPSATTPLTLTLEATSTLRDPRSTTNLISTWDSSAMSTISISRSKYGLTRRPERSCAVPRCTAVKLQLATQHGLKDPRLPHRTSLRP